MLHRQTQPEVVTGVLSSTPVPESAPVGYAQAGQELAVRSATQQKELTVPQETQVSRFNGIESLRVTLWVFGMGFLANKTSEYLIAATFGMLTPFPVGSGTIPEAISSAALVVNVAVVGVVVGLLANRRTMTTSIVAANIAGLLITVLVCVYLYATLPPEAWAASTLPTFGILFRAVTVTVTEAAVAHYVAHKFRKEP